VESEEGSGACTTGSSETLNVSEGGKKGLLTAIDVEGSKQAESTLGD